MKKIKKAIIPIAGFGTRMLPFTKETPKEMYPILNKPTIQYIVSEAIASGIEEIIFITNETKNSLKEYFETNEVLEMFLEQNNKEHLLDDLKKMINKIKIEFVFQSEQLGLGHAVLQAKSLIDEGEYFCLLLGDDVMWSDKEPVLKQLIRSFDKYQRSIIGTQEIERKDVEKYGILDLGKELEENTWEIKGMVEKPSIDAAPSNYSIMGRYILPHSIFSKIEKNSNDKVKGEIQITNSIEELINEEGIIGYKFDGTRYDMGSTVGAIKAQIDFALRDKNIANEIYDFIAEKRKK